MTAAAGPVVVGVQHDQPIAVVVTAAQLAGSMSRALVCIEADSRDVYLAPAVGIGAYAFADAAYRPRPEDDADQLAADRLLRQRVGDILGTTDVQWTFERRPGEPFEVLSRTAEEVDAALIVVGTREAGFSHALLEFFTGSVATRLAHGQHRPVVVVPLAPSDAAGRPIDLSSDADPKRL